jgi:hypothetical protein
MKKIRIGGHANEVEVKEAIAAVVEVAVVLADSVEVEKNAAAGEIPVEVDVKVAIAAEAALVAEAVEKNVAVEAAEALTPRCLSHEWTRTVTVKFHRMKLTSVVAGLSKIDFRSI